ncbi:MAG: hypothetical protein ACYCTB_09750 [bacterium]
MAEIFISHSQLDDELKNFFAKVFSSTKVRAIWEEYEKIINLEPITSEKIIEDIKRSNAVFIILSQNIENNQHTRGWINWESGVGSVQNKDIWVFEPFEQLGKNKTIVPHLSHYVLFEINDPWFSYINQIINSYNDLNVFASMPTKLTELTTLGGLAGAIVADKSNGGHTGIEIKCNDCSSIYNIHFPIFKEYSQFNFRCPVCNITLSLPYDIFKK